MPISPSASSSAWPIRSRSRIAARQLAARGPTGNAHADRSGHRCCALQDVQNHQPIENLNGLIAHYTRNVKRWRDGEMVLRWIGTALHEACSGFRAVRGFRDMKRLDAALALHLQLKRTTDMQRKVA